ncbi:aldehyde dehydrogenase family protein [Sphingobium subterraneum]|uniref:Aldehyde dehydrogenase (NAD+) n=1 Tax=Sphingobium subterraneum TaxID=627688 RepID=A0A841J486_9SPHN|nr:aldehyde dehydrogenase family protein [Sphingobium subterraneum]MBB6123395.1 aldehyde dehydrogenase (NAD+) [Sphingobium subterraneum]
MREHLKFYINGEWVEPIGQVRAQEVINPATEQPIARIALGEKADADRAVEAAKRAFESYSQTSKAERVALLGRVIDIFKRRMDELAQTISAEMGAPLWLATAAQAPSGMAHFAEAMRILDDYEFEDTIHGARILREPIGVCAFITPWNWPINQIACKVAPALAAGCTVVLKPSELAPLNAILLTEILDEAGVPPGVFNLVNGDGPGVGEALASHPDVDLVSFTGSTRAGILVSKAAAATIKRVTLELGGKSPNIILDDADLNRAVSKGIFEMMNNSGQSCNAPSRMFVPRELHDRAVEIARATVDGIKVMSPDIAERGAVGPLANAGQFHKVQAMIQAGIDEGAQLVAGGIGRPEPFERGYFVKPTVFADVTNEMIIAREEIFGPVLAILPYDDEDHAVAMANDTPYGLSSYVQSGSIERARKVARRIRAGDVRINGAGANYKAPFGGYKQSGNGREWGAFGFEEFLEVKAGLGWGDT